jgi:hypothetical protein
MRNPIKKLKDMLCLERGVLTERGDVQMWVLPETKKFHRDRGPAVIQKNGTLEYYYEGKRHRIDGPAVIVPSSGLEQYWINGIVFEKSQFDLAIKKLI